MHAPAPDCEAFADLLDAQADGALPPSAAQAVAAVRPVVALSPIGAPSAP